MVGVHELHGCSSILRRAQVTRSQNTAEQRENARFGDDGSCEHLQKVLELEDFNGLSKVCMAVSMRVAAMQGDVMNRNWNATTPEVRRKEGRKSCRDAN